MQIVDREQLFIPWKEIEFLELIGTGYFAQVFKVRVKGEEFAAKKPQQNLTDLASAETNYRQFVQEIFHLGLGGLRHPHIIEVRREKHC